MAGRVVGDPRHQAGDIRVHASQQDEEPDIADGDRTPNEEHDASDECERVGDQHGNTSRVIFVGEVGCEQGHEDCGRERRHTHELGPNRAVSHRANNGGCEVRQAKDDDSRAQGSNPDEDDLDVPEDGEDLSDLDFAMVEKVHVELQPFDASSRLNGRQDLDVCRVVGEEPKDEEGETDGEDAFETEDPAPTTHPTNALHV